MKLEAIIFDLDGVITDTAEYHYRAWQRLADEEGLPFDRQINEHLRGVSRRSSLEIILAGRPATEAEIAELTERKNRYYVAMLAGVTPADLLPGAVDLLRELRAAGVKVGIGSVSKNAHTVLDRLGICDLLDAIADGFSAERSKPAPDLFLKAAEMLGVYPAFCAVVEDAAVGIEAALAAGMWAIGLGPASRVGHAHARFESLAGVTLAAMRRPCRTPRGRLRSRSSYRTRRATWKPCSPSAMASCAAAGSSKRGFRALCRPVSSTACGTTCP